MRVKGVASTSPCTQLRDMPALQAAFSTLLRGKADALLSAGKSQITERRQYCWQPEADPTSLAGFSPLI